MNIGEFGGILVSLANVSLFLHIKGRRRLRHLRARPEVPAVASITNIIYQVHELVCATYIMSIGYGTETMFRHKTYMYDE